MSAATNCACPCPTPEIVTVPGSAGTDGTAGAAGTNGVNAYTVTTADVLLPAAAGPVVLATSFAVASWMSIGQVIFISDGVDWAHFRVLTLPSSTSATLQWLDYPDDAAGTATIGSGATVSPAGVFALPAPLPTALTNNTTGSALAALAAGVGIFNLSFNHTWVGGTAAAEPVTTFTPGFKFKILSWVFVTDQALTGGGGSRVCNMEINATDVGTVPSTCTVTFAGAATPGTVVAATAVAGANTGSATDTVSIEIAAGGTALTAGSGQFIVTVQNMDTADAVSSLNTSINTLITALT